jgi:hypothetical protein
MDPVAECREVVGRDEIFQNQKSIVIEAVALVGRNGGDRHRRPCSAELSELSASKKAVPYETELCMLMPI